MLNKVITLAGLLLVAANTSGGEVYKWIDERGQTHFGDSVPEAQKRKAKPLDLKHAETTAAQRRQAREQSVKEKIQAAELHSQRIKNDRTALSSGGESDNAQDAGNDSTCAEQWQKYDESYACLNPYRLANGAVKAEGFKHCAVVEQPECE